VAQELEAVVLRCLAKAPAERYADANDLEAALAICQAAGSWTAKDAADWWRCRVKASNESSQAG
jgi:serine/threonine-protein kinase